MLENGEGGEGGGGGEGEGGGFSFNSPSSLPLPSGSSSSSSSFCWGKEARKMSVLMSKMLLTGANGQLFESQNMSLANEILKKVF